LRERVLELTKLPRELLALRSIEPPRGRARPDEEPGQAVRVEELVDERGDGRVLAEQIEVAQPALQRWLGRGPHELERPLLGDPAEQGEERRRLGVDLGAEEPVDGAGPLREAGGEALAEAERRGEPPAIVGVE